MKILFIILTCLFFINIPLVSQEFGEDIVIGKTVTINSKILNEERELFIYLPNGYNRSTSNYPVLYMMDGAAHFIHGAGVVSFLSANGIIPQMIIVAIPNTDRNRDFTPTKTNNLNTSGNADNFLKFLEDELIPYIDKEYRTESFRILFGHSLTGMFSLYAMINKPHLFNSYIAASPYLMYDNDFIVNYSEKNLKDFSDKKFLYFTVGNEPDYYKSVNNISDIFNKKSPENFNWERLHMEKEDHASIPLKTLYNGLEFIFSGWKLPPNFAGSSDLNDFKNHFREESDRLDFTFKIPEATINIFGYQVMAAGRINDAIEIFNFNVIEYPGSANVYDSLGEALEADNQLGEAKKNYETAYKIGKEINDPNLHFYEDHLNKIKEKLMQ